MSAAEHLSVTATGPGVEFDQVSLTLGRTLILDHVSFSIRPGSVHALVGPNGGGKSSLIKTPAGANAASGSSAPELARRAGRSATCPRPWSLIAACR